MERAEALMVMGFLSDVGGVKPGQKGIAFKKGAGLSKESLIEG